MIEIGELVDDPLDLLVQLESLDAPWECCSQFVERIAVEQVPGWEETLSTYIDRDDSWPAVLLALRLPVSDISKADAVRRIDGRHLNGIEFLIMRNELDEPT